MPRIDRTLTLLILVERLGTWIAAMVRRGRARRARRRREREDAQEE